MVYFGVQQAFYVATWTGFAVNDYGLHAFYGNDLHSPFTINRSKASAILIRVSKLFVVLPADGLEPGGYRPTTNMVLTIKLEVCSLRF